jgi:2-polyprenyl-3-methyl-5-hydroxy-6-metoxy-1,4-benzoquinol methylase
LLLIKTNLSAREIFSKFKDRGYKNIQNSYNNSYFLTDCGGYDLFKKSKGNSLEDPRLLAAYYLANPKTGQKILDIGCGRGELAFALAKAGAEVTGIDYSESAISIAKDMFCDGNNSLPNLKYFNDDFLQMQIDSKFDVIIAMDLIEHIEQENLGVFLKKISTLLKINGFFIVHTAPNLLYYLYKYETNRKLVHEAGWFLPKNPRSYYEDLMHINEQTPGSIQESLTAHFENVLVWTTTLPDNLGSLCRSFSQEELIDARDIFAVASHSPVEKEILIFRLSQQKLNPAYLSVEISSKITSVRCSADDVFIITIDVMNRSRERFVSLDPYPINISYHWMDKEEHYMKFGLERTSIKIPLEPSEKREFTLPIKAPDIPGCYILQITLVQESNFWFEHLLKNLPFSIDVEVI